MSFLSLRQHKTTHQTPYGRQAYSNFYKSATSSLPGADDHQPTGQTSHSRTTSSEKDLHPRSSIRPSHCTASRLSRTPIIVKPVDGPQPLKTCYSPFPPQPPFPISRIISNPLVSVSDSYGIHRQPSSRRQSLRTLRPTG